MATTVGQHSVATFTSPVNGTTPIDANTVRGNDNTMRVAYVDHDADPGIHVQSSTLASRPVAGTAGRKWITEDSGVYTLWFDDGTNWHPVSSENVALAVLATEALNKGDVVKLVGWNNGQNLPEVAKTTSTADIAFAVMSANATINTLAYAINTGILQNINTNSFAPGTLLYPSATGGFTSTKPTSGLYQIVAYVLRQNTNNGVVFVEFSGPRIVETSANTASTVVQRDASGNFSAGTITASLTGSISGNAATATALQTARTINGVSFDGTANITVAAAAGTLTGTTLASNVVSSSLTSVGTLGSLTVTNPINGSVTGSSGSTTGNAATATALQTARTINGVSFDGTANITVTAAAGTLTGSTLASGVTASSLTSVGTLSSLTVSGASNLSGKLTVTSTSEVAKFGSASATNAYVAFARDNTTLGFIGNAGGIMTGGVATDFGITTTGSRSLVLGTVDLPRATIDTSGNIGLGVTPFGWSSSYRFIDVGSGGSAAFGTVGGTADTTNNAYHNGTSWLYKAAAAATLYRQQSGVHYWFTAPSGTAGNAISFTQAMTLNADGNLSIGTTNSSSPIVVKANATDSVALRVLRNASGAATIQITDDPVTVANIAIGYDHSSTYGSVTSSAILGLGAGGSERARITSGGNFGVNCSATNAKLEVVATTGEVFRADAAGGALRVVANQDGVVLGRNIDFGGSGQFGGGVRVLSIREADTVPTSNPTGAGILYVEGGALKYRGTSGTVTTIANA